MADQPPRSFPNLEKARQVREQKRKEREEKKKELNLHTFTPDVNQPIEKPKDEKMEVEYLTKEEFEHMHSALDSKINSIIEMFSNQEEDQSEDAPEPQRKKQKPDEQNTPAHSSKEKLPKEATEQPKEEKEGWDVYDGLLEGGKSVVKTASGILSTLIVPLMLVGLKTYRDNRSVQQTVDTRQQSAQPALSTTQTMDVKTDSPMDGSGLPVRLPPR